MLRATKVRIYPTPEQAELSQCPVRCGSFCIQQSSAYQKTRLPAIWGEFKSAQRFKTVVVGGEEIP